LDRPAPPLRLLLQRAERTEVSVRAHDLLHGLCAESPDQLVLEVGLADVEPEPLHGRAGEAGAEARSLQAAAEIPLLAGVAEAGEPNAKPCRPEPVQEPRDRLRAADRHDPDAFDSEITAAALGQRLDGAAVADPLNEHDGGHAREGSSAATSQM